MQVRPSLDPSRDDAFHPPVAGALDLERYSEWHHFNFNDDASDVYGLFNLALSGDVHHPSRARAGVSLVDVSREWAVVFVAAVTQGDQHVHVQQAYAGGRRHVVTALDVAGGGRCRGAHRPSASRSACIASLQRSK